MEELPPYEDLDFDSENNENAKYIMIALKIINQLDLQENSRNLLIDNYMNELYAKQNIWELLKHEKLTSEITLRTYINEILKEQNIHFKNTNELLHWAIANNKNEIVKKSWHVNFFLGGK